MIPFSIITELHLGPLTLQFWGLMVALGFVVGLFFALWLAKRRRLSQQIILDVTLLMFLGTIIGGRLWYVILYWHDFTVNPWHAFNIWEGGMVFYGGLLLSLVFMGLYFWIKRIPFLPIADVLVVAGSLGTAVGRIGCFFIADHIGRPTDFFLAVNYFGESRHNTALYSILANVLIFAVTWWLSTKLNKPGYLVAVYLLIYGLTRIPIDQLRATDLPISDPRFYGFTASQYFSVVMIIAAMLMFWYLVKNKNDQTLLSKKS